MGLYGEQKDISETGMRNDIYKNTISQPDGLVVCISPERIAALIVPAFGVGVVLLLFAARLMVGCVAALVVPAFGIGIVLLVFIVRLIGGVIFVT